MTWTTGSSAGAEASDARPPVARKPDTQHASPETASPADAPSASSITMSGWPSTRVSVFILDEDNLAEMPATACQPPRSCR